jgi:hypothetical protein
MELPSIWRGWDLGLDLADDLSAAAWLVPALRPWGAPGEPVRVASFVPGSYEAFAAIHHDDRHDGSLPASQLAALGTLLAAHTAMPGECVFCFWIGCGTWGGTVGYSDGPTPEETKAALRIAVERAERKELDPIPLLRLPHREHYVFTGMLSRTRRPFLLGGTFEQSPTIWWPADRAWLVATEVDGYVTYVGGTRMCVDAILAAPTLKAARVTADDPIAPGLYG